jgi:KipI family sensor histidine kinase inhibitor
VLLELDDNAAVRSVARAARAHFGDQLVEIVPGHCTLLLAWDEGVDDAAALMPNLKSLASLASAFKLDASVIGDDHAAVVAIPVVYDGADLEAVAASLALSSEGVVELHSGAVYSVAFVGFSPGFPYLVAEPGDDASQLLELPRLATPRTEVAAGSVAVAAGYCGIYPRSSPGGWNLLGRTEVVLFDAARAAPALLVPGARVRFEAV